MIQNVFIAFISLILISSCVTPQAVFQSKVYQPQKKGIIRYSLNPLLFQPDAIQQRRRSAKIKMKEFCETKEPKVISEERVEQTAGYHTHSSYQDHFNEYSDSGDVSTISQPIVNTYNVINFECQ